MANLLSTTVNGNVLVGPSGTAHAYDGAATGKLYFGNQVSDSPTNYHITTNIENFGGSYSKLDIRWYTGQRFYAHNAYGGFRFKEIVGEATIFSISEGDSNVRVTNNLHIGSAGGWITDLLNAKQAASTAINTGNIGSQSVSFATSAESSSVSDGLGTSFLGNGSTNISSGFSRVIRNENGLGGNLNYAPVLHLAASDTMWQIAGGHAGSTNLQWRSGYAGTWSTPWWTILHAGNYTSFAPSLTGTGASGSWGISITGNAATATTATNVAYSGLTGTVPTWNQNTTGTASNANYLNSTRDTPANALQYWQESGLGINEAPSGDWHNTIRMGHGSPLSYYSNTLAIRMTGSGVGDIYTQTIMDGNRQGWKKHWNDSNLTNLNQLTNGPGYVTSSGTVAYANQLTVVGAGATVINANTFQTGILSNYYSTAAISNIPEQGYGSLYNFGGYDNTSLSLQLFSVINHDSSTPTRELYFRMGNNLGFANDWRTIVDSKNIGSQSVANADTVDGLHETAFLRVSANSSSPLNGTFAIGSASGRNFIQSHSGQPLDINPLGNSVTVGSGLAVTGAISASNFSGSSSGTNTGDQTNISGNSNTTSQRVFDDLKINFPSGAGGGYNFGNNHYSMGLDSGNGSWTHPHYRDLIIGYHTGIRLGANYSGVRFYSDSPTTDANSDGNGDGGEALLMTVGGYVGTANHTDVVVNNNLIANSSLRAPIFYDSNDTGYYGNFAGFSRMSEVGVTNNYVYNYDSIDSPRAVAEFGVVGKYVATRSAAADFPSFSFENVYGNHSWGIMARFHIRQSGADRPSIQISSGSSNERWNIGFCTGTDNNFRISQNMGYRPDGSGISDGWGTERFRINTDGTAYLQSTIYTHEISHTNGRVSLTGNLHIDSYNGNDIYMNYYSARGTRIYVGSGTLALHVNTDGLVYMPTVVVNSHSDNTKGYRIHNTSGTSVSAMFTNSSNALVIAAGAVDQINLNKKVYVNGVALGVNFAPSATAGRIDASNDIVAFNSSDERLKENITPIANALDKVKSLTGVEFDWKSEHKEAHGHEGRDTGIIAQQVLAVMPTAVRTNDTGFLAVRYEKLIGLLIEGMKEQQAQINELKAKLDAIAR